MRVTRVINHSQPSVKMALEAAVADYQSTLEDLSFNSKPHINMLTMLADENHEHSTHIVKVIEDRLLQVGLDSVFWGDLVD